MSQEQVLGILRHLLTTAGGVIVSKGVTDEATMTTIIGGIVAVAGIIWSVYSNKKSQLIVQADKAKKVN